jgi:hypothetical protein
LNVALEVGIGFMAESKIELALRVLDMHIALLRAKDPFSDDLVYEIRERIGSLFQSDTIARRSGDCMPSRTIIVIRLQPCAAKKSAM